MKRVLLLGLLALGCDQGQPASQGASEPFRVRGGQFISGALPGALPTDAGADDAGSPDAGSGGPPRITSLDLLNIVFYQGQGGVKIAGRGTPNAWAVGLRLADVGSGYWVVPTGSIDPATGQLTWEAPSDFSFDIPSRFHELRVVALDEQGNAGQQVSQALCVADRVPDHLNACDPGAAPPEAVISLRWDTNVDLDLQVVTPDGTLVDAKHPSSLPPDDAGAYPPEVAQMDRDSNGNCVIDGIRFENLVWEKVRPHGLYGVYVNLFDSCKQPSVRFTASVYLAEPDGDGGKKLHRWFEQSGELLDFQANGGANRGLFLFEFDFQ